MSPRSDKQFNELREKSKENILDSALKLFSSKGFFNTSIRQIAEKAKISNGLLYNYFSSKEDLLTEIINKSFNILDGVIENDDKISSEEKIRNTIEKFFDLVQTKQKLMKMLLQIGLQAEKFEFVNKMIANKYKQEVNILSKSFRELGFEDYEIEANLFLATLDGLMIQFFLMKETIPLEAMKKVLINKYKR